MNDIDMKDFEGLVKDAMGKLDPSEVTIEQEIKAQNIINEGIGEDNLKLGDTENKHLELTDGQ